MSAEPIRTIVVDDDHTSAAATMAILKKFPAVEVTNYIDNSPELMSRLPELDAELLVLDIEIAVQQRNERCVHRQEEVPEDRDNLLHRSRIFCR